MLKLGARMAGICFPSSELEVEDLNEDFYVFKSRKWPESWLQVPSVGNGHLATVIKYPWIHMSGLFNGKETKSQRVKIPSTVDVKMKSPSDDQLIEYKLDTRIGTFIEQHKINGWVTTLQWFAHRTILPILVFQVVVTKDESNVKSQSQDSTAKSVDTKSNIKDSLTIELDVSRTTTSEDIDLEELTSEFTNARFYHGRTRISEDPEFSKCQDIYILHDFIPGTLEIQRTQSFKKWTFVTSIHYSKDVVLQAYRHGKELEKFDNLEKSHHKEWLKLWTSGRIELQGNLKCSQAAASSLYNILSSIPIQKVNPLSSEDTCHTESYTTLFTGLSPSGLPWGDEESYQGHTFWDAETWMFPAILMLHHEFSATLLHSRVRTIDVAARNARVVGLKGLRYPWESALTGIETAPDEECGHLEIHINGDISMAIQQYMMISPHCKDFPESYLNILKGIGDFWLSRAEYDSKKQMYEIKGVMPPDEFARCVDNSAYTNAIAALSLRGAYVASKMSADPRASIYEEAAAQMYIPYDPKYDYHPEFDGFEMGTRIKQADVVLLGFPLMMDMMDSTRKNDLEIYEKTTSVGGPAMSDSMHAIGWLEVGEEKRAHESFVKMFKHISGDFQVWTEEKGGKGSPNFITGMGGYLQALLFGFGGLRILDDSLKINPSIMEATSSIAWHGIKYRGCSFDLEIDKTKTMILTLTSTIEKVKVSLEVHEKGRVLLKEGCPLTINATVGFLRVEN